MTDQIAKSLRWLANQFPAVDAPKDDADRISTCIHLYCTAGADAIDTMTAQLAALQAENEKLRAQLGPNDPLTPEELRGMDGEPVWNDVLKHWSLIDAENEKTVGKDGLWRPLDDLYYRRKPDGGGE